MDNEALSGGIDKDAMLSRAFCGDEDKSLKEVLTELKQVAIDTNKEWASILGIGESTAITTVNN